MYICMCLLLCVFLCEGERVTGSRRSLDFFFFFSFHTYTTCVDTPTAGILHTQAQWEPGGEPRNGAPAGGASSWPKSIYEKPCKYNRIITLTGLRRLQYTVWFCVCSCRKGYVHVCTLTPVVSIRLVSFFKAFFKVFDYHHS